MRTWRRNPYAPAVTIGLAAGGRFPVQQIVPYVIAQVIGAVVAAALLYVIASGAPGFDLAKGFLGSRNKCNTC